MKRQHRLTPEEQAQQDLSQEQNQQQIVHEFANADAMLRHDAEHTLVPPSIARRLQQSIAQIPRRSWLRRFFEK
jgi:hypothetical protein